MKPVLLILAAVLTVIPQSFPKSSQIKTDAPFSPGAEVSKDEQGHTVEKGSINGVQYLIYYTDGSGRFLGKRGGSFDWTAHDEHWRVRCKKDAMSDQVSCDADRYDLHLSITRWKPDKLLYIVIIGDNHYPRSRVAIRFDGEQPILGGRIQGYAFENGEAIMDRLAKAKKVTTRYKVWPSGVDVDSEWEVYGAKEVIDYLKWAVVRIK